MSGRDRRALLLALALAAAVLLPRAWLMARAHSESYDDEYHLVRGARFFLGTLGGMPQTDPPLGEALTALPMVLTNHNPAWTGTLYDHSLEPETILLLTALWRSLLFLPAIAVGFLWCRRLYGPSAGWLAAALLLTEPTFAAHIPVAALDALGVVGALAGSWLLWRYFESPSAGRLGAAALGAAAALLMKHTVVMLPFVALAYALLAWVVRPMRTGVPAPVVAASLPRRAGTLVAGAALTGAALWSLLLFDFSRPDLPPAWQQEPTALTRALDRPLPAGMYVGSVLRGSWHAEQGHPAYLLGEKSRDGWWYYFPVVLAYKVPLGVGAILLLALASPLWRRPRFDEWGLAVPAVLWTGLMLGTRINIGLRHFLPAYVFLLLLGTRCLAPRDPAPARPEEGPPRGIALVAWVAFAAAALHALAFHPDYIAYLNWPRARAYLDISDSNVDWGQGLKQARAWIDSHPQKPGRPIYLLYFGDPNSPRRVVHYLGDRVTLLWPRPPEGPPPLPSTGLLIASPVWVAGPFDRADRYAALRTARPQDVIGHALLVYDLDALQGAHPRAGGG